MSIPARNDTHLPLTLKDYYQHDPSLNVGYFGVQKIEIPAHETRPISYAVFVEKSIKQFKSQEIHVMSGEDTRLVLHHEDFVINKDRQLVFEMGGNDTLVARFVRREQLTIAQRLRRMLRFRAGAANEVRSANAV